MDVVKEKVNSILVKYPAIDEPLKKVADKAGVDKAFVAIGAVAIPALFILMFGVGEFIV